MNSIIEIQPLYEPKEVPTKQTRILPNDESDEVEK